MKHLLIIALLATPASALDTNDLLGLVAMPLAVAAVADVTGVPVEDLSRLVSTLNRADVAPVQVVEVLRYSPPALIVVQQEEPRFVQFVETQVTSGVTGQPLFESVVQRLRTYDIAVSPASEITVVGENFIPPVVMQRVVERRDHPHGGPPGQIKKQLGLQTGAEVVHGRKSPRIKVARVERDDDRGGKIKEKSKGQSGGNGKGKGKGHGKGKGGKG